MALGFGVGSRCSPWARSPAMLELNAVVIGIVFALGAVCFTTAAAVQWRTAMIRRSRLRLRDPRLHGRRRSVRRNAVLQR